MRRGLRAILCPLLTTIVLANAGCQSPTDADDTPDVDDFLIVNLSPGTTVTASESTDGRTYRVVRGNNQPDEILAFDWKTSFAVGITLNDKADDDDYLAFPVKISSATVTVKQASGGVVTTPTGGDTEHSDYVVSNTTSNTFGAVNSTNTLTFDVWYDLPSLRREALITVQLTFEDDDGLVFSKSVDVRVSP
jgi:hypothetical protein